VARTYIPSQVIDAHKMAKYMSRYQAILRASMVAIDPDYGAVFDALFAAILAFDAIASELYPLVD
jgi:hypothetical protein